MYATCLFCNNALGSNKSLEHFPVGRRIAYDESTGRPWVVCRNCERWSLSPLETRFEAIEEAEKAFRTTHMRVVSDNIGMAQLTEGLELVRIGKAKRPEFAAWRYGDQFGKRRRKYRWITAGTLGLILPPTLLSMGNLAGTIAFPALKAVLAGWSVYGGAASLGSAVTFFGLAQYLTLKNTQLPRLSVRDNTGELLRLTSANASATKVFPAGRRSDWYLSVQSVAVQPADGILKQLGHRETVLRENAPRVLTGNAALRALGILLPSINVLGGKTSEVQDAVNTINRSTDIQQILRHGGFPDPSREKYIDMSKYQFALSTFQPHFRLALEMSLHEGDERRAMEGELKDLEQRWREADGIAKIADEMFVAENVTAQIEAQRQQRSADE